MKSAHNFMGRKELFVTMRLIVLLLDPVWLVRLNNHEIYNMRYLKMGFI